MGRRDFFKYRSLITFFLIFGTLFYSHLQGSYFRTGIDIGFDEGPGFLLNFISKLIPVKNTKTRIAFGISFPDPGNPALARKVFINDATNGIPEKRGRVIKVRLDLIKRLKLRIYPGSNIYFGFRYAVFKGFFKYSGGNEEFEVSSNNSGIGIGTEHFFKLSSKKFLKITTGLDYYLPSHIHGHDTTYYPNDQNINPRRDYGYSNANKAVNQPELEFRIVFGITGSR